MRTWGWRTASAVSALATVVVVAGCSTVASGDLHTSGMIARIFVTAAPSGVGVGADLSAGGTTSVELRSGDRLVARTSGRQLTLRETTVLGMHSYAGTLPTTTAPGTTVRVDLRRSAGAPATSSVRLPGKVGLRAPTSGATVSRSRDLQLQVAPGPGAIRVDWEGSCVGNGEVRFEEGRPAVVPAGSLRLATPASGQPAVPDHCNVTLTVTRVLEGRLASSYKSGFIEGLRSQAIVIHSVA